MTFISLNQGVGADEVTAVWERLYRNASSLEQKLGIMINIVEKNDRETSDLLHESLDALLMEDINFTEATDKKIYFELLTVILQGLGKMRAFDAADTVYTVVKTFDDPLIKAEALITLGDMRARDYADDIAKLLQDLNLSPGADPDAAEKIAFGSIISLEKLAEDVGYEPVFYASMGWYSKRIKDRAKEALPLIMEDPTPVLSEIIQSGDMDIKIRALQAAEQSAAARENKIKLALTALREGLYNRSGDITMNTKLGELRMAALYLFIQHEADLPEIVPLLKDLIEFDYDEYETLTAVFALGINGSDEAATYLGELLSNFSVRQVSGVGVDDPRLLSAVIQALGMTKNQLATPYLVEAQYSDYTPAIVRQVNEALKSLE